MSYCRITLTASRAYVRFRLDGDKGQEFHTAVDELKVAMPSWARTWDPDRRVWTIDSSCYGRLLDWAHGWFDEDELTIERLDQRAHTPPPRPRPAPADPYTTLHLLPTAPPELVKAAYRCLAQLYHPDAGGSHERMVALNLAYERLTEAA